MARTELPNGVILPAEYSDDWYEDMTSNLTKLDDVIGSDSEKLNSNDVAFLRMSSAALTDGGTGNFSDLNSSNKLKTGDYVLDSGRKLYQIVSVNSATETFTVGNSLFKVTAESDLAPVAESGDYDDLDNKPDLNPYDQHIANTDIHVTTADKATWNTVTSKANDSDVVHKGGNETISGFKTFSSTIRLTAYPNIRMYLPDDEWNVQPATAKQSEIRFTDKNSVTISYFAFQHRPNSTEPFRTCWRQQKMDGTSGYYSIAFGNLGNFYPENDITITLGTQSSRWKSVYANNYYYGLNNVEFSTKFVTTDTNQTISGNKTFSSNVNVYNSDATATTPNLCLRSSKIEISSQGNTSGSQDLTFLDKNNASYAYIKGAIQSNGSAVKIRAVVKDSSDNSVINELQMLAYTNGNKAIFPSYSNEIDLGVSNYKWKSFNGVEPSSLSLPDLNNGIDISSYITHLDKGVNQYTPPSNGWLSIRVRKASLTHTSLMMSQTGGLLSSCETAEFSISGIILPVIANKNVDIYIIANSLESAKFYPCQGNV